MNKEYYELIYEFEKLKLGRFDKEPKELWKKRTVYQDGKVNELFKIYWHGYALGKCATK